MSGCCCVAETTSAQRAKLQTVDRAELVRKPAFQYQICDRPELEQN